MGKSRGDPISPPVSASKICMKQPEKLVNPAPALIEKRLPPGSRMPPPLKRAASFPNTFSLILFLNLKPAEEPALPKPSSAPSRILIRSMFRSKLPLRSSVESVTPAVATIPHGTADVQISRNDASPPRNVPGDVKAPERTAMSVTFS